MVSVHPHTPSVIKLQYWHTRQYTGIYPVSTFSTANTIGQPLSHSIVTVFSVKDRSKSLKVSELVWLLQLHVLGFRVFFQYCMVALYKSITFLIIVLRDTFDGDRKTPSFIVCMSTPNWQKYVFSFCQTSSFSEHKHVMFCDSLYSSQTEPPCPHFLCKWRSAFNHSNNVSTPTRRL